MTRFGFGDKEFAETAGLMADVILRNKDVKEEVTKLRGNFTKLNYCFDDEAIAAQLEKLKSTL